MGIILLAIMFWYFSKLLNSVAKAVESQANYWEMKEMDAIRREYENDCEYRDDCE